MQSFGLQRRAVIGDGNCLFRAISVGLVGNENLYQDLRSTAITHIRNHIEHFQIFFQPDNPNSININDHIQNEIDNLSQDGTYAGQESVIALSQALNLNILVTFGGRDSRVSTMEHFFQIRLKILISMLFIQILVGAL